MRGTRAVLLCALVFGVVAMPAWGGEEGAWFDLENCSICRNLAAEEGLMENMKWETYVISNGMMTVSVIDEHYEDEMERASKKIEAVVAKLQTGELVPLCGFCTSYGNLMMNGAKMEEFDTAAGQINLMTSDKPEVVEMIHVHAKRTLDDGAKLAEAHAEHGHEGHAHD